MFTSLWKYRTFILSTSISELRNRYAGSSLGILWNVLNPLAQIIVYTFVFAEVMAARLPEVQSSYAFAIYLCSGLLPWISFSETVLRGSGSLLENSNYLKKLSIPESVFVAQTAFSSTLSLAISVVLLFTLSLISSFQVNLSWLAVVPILLLFQGLAFGLALALSCLNVFFRDIGQIVGIALQIMMWSAPIVYVKNILPVSYQKVLMFNPIFPYIESMHQIVVFGNVPGFTFWFSMIGFTLFSLVVGNLTLRIFQTEVRDLL